MEAIERFVNSDGDDDMDCHPHVTNMKWWLNSRAASDLPRSVCLSQSLICEHVDKKYSMQIMY